MIALLLLATLTSCTFVPEIALISTSDFLNEFLVFESPKVDKAIKNYTIQDIYKDDVGLGIIVNLTDIQKQVEILWKASVLKPTDDYNFTVSLRNINVTLNATLQVKERNTNLVRGELLVNITEIEVDASMYFTGGNQCKGGLNFNLQCLKALVNAEKLVIKVDKKRFTNTVITFVERLLRDRFPGIVQNLIETALNPMITNVTCAGIFEVFNVSDSSYVAAVSMFSVPRLEPSTGRFGANLTLSIINQATNVTWINTENDTLCDSHIYDKKANVTLFVSSNFVNVVTWLVADSQALQKAIFDDPKLPIRLNTDSLSVLLPGLRQWRGKEVILYLTESSKVANLFLRAGRVLGSLSLNVDFLVNMGPKNKNVTECIDSKQCFSAVNLNITIPLSVSVFVESDNMIKGKLHKLSVYEIQASSPYMKVDTSSLIGIINSILLGALSDVDEALAKGIPIPIGKFKNLHVTELFGEIFLDSANIGAIVNLKK